MKKQLEALQRLREAEAEYVALLNNTQTVIALVLCFSDGLSRCVVSSGVLGASSGARRVCVVEWRRRPRRPDLRHFP